MGSYRRPQVLQDLQYFVWEFSSVLIPIGYNNKGVLFWFLYYNFENALEAALQRSGLIYYSFKKHSKR